MGIEKSMSPYVDGLHSYASSTLSIHRLASRDHPERYASLQFRVPSIPHKSGEVLSAKHVSPGPRTRQVEDKVEYARIGRM